MRKLVTFAVAVVAVAGIGTFASSNTAEAFGWGCGASYYRTAACGCPSYYRSGVYYSRGIYRRAAVRRYVSYRRRRVCAAAGANQIEQRPASAGLFAQEADHLG
jgi:hypothetical protein